MLLLLHTFLVACTVPEIPEFANGGGSIYENGNPSEEEDVEGSDTSEQNSPNDTGSEESEERGETSEERDSDESGEANSCIGNSSSFSLAFIQEM